MKRRIFILVSIWLLLFTRCSKDDDFILEGPYQLPTYANMGAIHMFTSTGEVLDGEKITDFINRSKQFSTFFEIPVQETDLSTIFCLNSSAMPIDADSYCNIQITDDKATINARLITINTFGKTLDAEVIKLDPLMILTASAGTEYMEKPDDIADYYNTTEFPKIKEMIRVTTPVPPILDNWKFQKRYNFPFIIENDEISVPILIHAHWHNSPQQISWSQGKICNLVNENFLRNLSVNDTILIQEGKAVLQKR